MNLQDYLQISGKLFRPLLKVTLVFYYAECEKQATRLLDNSSSRGGMSPNDIDPFFSSLDIFPTAPRLDSHKKGVALFCVLDYGSVFLEGYIEINKFS